MHTVALLTMYLLICVLPFLSLMFSCLVLVPQTGGQAEMEEGQLQSDTQHAPQEQPQEGDQSSDQAQVQTSASAEALSENLDQEEPPVDVQERDDSAGQLQAKPLWKPIPPLLPEPHRSGNTEVRDQSCQTEERLQQTSAGSHGHNTGG